MGWRDKAACRGQDLRLFFGPGEGEERESTQAKEHRIAQAKAICRTCEVVADCLQEHLDFRAGQYGVAGGLDEDERRKLRRREMRRAAAERRQAS